MKDSYDKKLAAVATALAAEANQAMVSAVTNQGLTIQEYQAILKQAQNDPAVRRKIVEKLKPARQHGL